MEYTKVRRTFVKVTGANQNQKYYFDQDQTIQHETVVGFQHVCGSSEIAPAFPWNGTSSSSADWSSSFLITLVNTKGEEVFSNVVPAAFVTSVNGGLVRLFMSLKDLDLSQSFVKFHTVPEVGGDAIYLNFLLYLK